MSVQDLGAIGELIAAIATVATLIYLTISIRHNSKTVTSLAKQDLGQSLLEFNRTLFADEETTRIWNLGRKSLDNLSELERARFSGLLIMGLTTSENAYYQARQGHLDEQYLDRNNRILAWWGTQPGMIQMWPEVREFITDDFQDVVDQYLTSNPNVVEDDI